MRLNVSEELHLDASPEDVWKLLRDTPRLARLLPGVEEVTPLDEAGVEAYAAVASEKIGPFKVTLHLAVRVAETREPSLLRASLRGADSAGINRVTGSLEIALDPAPPGTRMRFSAEVEILGKLAALGAVPVRRRAAQSFAEFARNIQAQFAKEGA
jgi:carbon monoxide dehydrogenase subunit G